MHILGIEPKTSRWKRNILPIKLYVRIYVTVSYNTNKHKGNKHKGNKHKGNKHKGKIVKTRLSPV